MANRTASANPTPPARPGDPVFIALADATRRRMLERLADGPASVTELNVGLPITRQAVSKHLRVLAEAGLVTDRKTGRERHYALAPGSLSAATNWLTAIETRWDARIAALRRLVENPSEPDDSSST